MKVRRVEGEYRVVFNDYDQGPRGKRDEEMAAYYTTDADDALETARDMARRRAEVIAQRAARKPGARGSRSTDSAGWVDVVGFLRRQSGPRTVPEIVLGVFGAPGPRDHDGAERERAVRRALAAGAKDILNFKGQEYWAAPKVHPGRAH
jgi:1,2-phenylacetyl-CoA epoxidase PaaB subunit